MMELSASHKNNFRLALQQNNQLLAVKLLYEQYADKIYGLLVKKSGDETKAEEVLKFTFEQVYTELSQMGDKEFSFIRILEIARKLCTPVKNQSGSNAVTTEEKVLEMIICNGVSITRVAEQLQKSEEEVRGILKTSLRKYKTT